MEKLSEKDANELLSKIKAELEITEDARDFCLWLAYELEKKVGVRVDSPILKIKL